MQAEQTSQITGVLIGAGVVALGSVLTFLGTVLNNWFTARREVKQWERQQDADRDQRRHEEKKAERERRREIYENSLTYLTRLMTALENDDEFPAEQIRERVEESVKWLNLLSLPFRVNENQEVANFHSTFENFIAAPVNYVGDMKAAVTGLASTDSILFPNPPKEIVAPKEKPQLKKGIITFQMSVDDNFRKEQIIKGIEVPKSDNFTFRLTDLSEGQRELLANIYFQSYKTIPSNVTLPMPLPQRNATHPYTSGQAWKGRCDPGRTSPEDILKMWETDYNEAFKKVNSTTADQT